jgi:hypothetical protein
LLEQRSIACLRLTKCLFERQPPPPLPLTRPQQGPAAECNLFAMGRPADEIDEVAMKEPPS